MNEINNNAQIIEKAQLLKISCQPKSHKRPECESPLPPPASEEFGLEKDPVVEARLGGGKLGEAGDPKASVY